MRNQLQEDDEIQQGRPYFYELTSQIIKAKIIIPQIMEKEEVKAEEEEVEELIQQLSLRLTLQHFD